MANTAFAAGSTSKIVTVKAIVISTGLPYTAGAHNTATISATYTRLGATPTTITLVTATAGTYTSSGFVHRGKGVYEIGAPTAALASGVDAVDFAVDGIADVLFTETRVELPTSDPRAAALSAADVNAEVVDVIRTDTVAELTAPPAANAALSAKINWLFMKARNVITQTATTQLVKADDGTTTVGTSTVSDNGTVATRGEFS
jgi:hypothetical protein